MGVTLTSTEIIRDLNINRLELSPIAKHRLCEISFDILSHHTTALKDVEIYKLNSLWERDR